MKKYLVSLILLVSVIFFGANKVSALEDTSNMTLLGSRRNTGSSYSYTYNVYLTDDNKIYANTINNNNTNQYKEKFYDIDGYNYIIYVKNSYSGSIENLIFYIDKPYIINNIIKPIGNFTQKILRINEVRYLDYPLIEETTNCTPTSCGVSYNSSTNYFTNVDIYNYDTGLKVIEKNLNISLGIQDPTEINFTKVDIHDTDYFGNDYISSVALNINFDIFDNSNFKYQFSLDSGNSWQDININDYVLNLNNNATVLVRVLDRNNNYIIGNSYTITSIDDNPKIDYKIEDGSEQGKKLTVRFKNFNKTDYIVMHNFQTGEEIIYEMKNQIIYDNLNIDNSYQFDVYDRDDNFIKTINIDISLDEININKDRYVSISYNYKRRAYLGTFFNTKSNDKCYYKFADNENEELDCKNQFIIEKNDNKENSYFDLLIYDKNNNLVLKKTINYQFNDNAPKFTFESYYKSDESKQVLKIIIDNLNNNDNIYYSTDNDIWNELPNQRINELDFYVDTEIYFKIIRNDNIISRAYFNVIYKAFENSEKNNNNVNNFTSFIAYFTNLFKNIRYAPLEYSKTIYNYISNSKLGFYLIFIIASSILIAIIKASRR